MSDSLITAARPVDGRDRTIISGGRVLTREGLVHADVIVEGRHIVAITTEATPSDDRTQIIDAARMIAMPGLCNAHTHTHNVLSRGLFDVGCLEMLISIQWPSSRHRTAQETYAAAALNALENLKSGTTSVCEQFVMLPQLSLEHVEAVVRAYSDIGLRATIAALISDLPFYPTLPGFLESLPADLQKVAADQRPAKVDFRPIAESVQRWHGASDGRILLGLSPSVPVVCSDALITDAMELASAQDLNVYIHTAQTHVEADAGMRRYGESIIAHLNRIGALTPHTVLAHAIWVSDADLDLIASSGAMIVHAPSSNLRIGNGIARVREMLNRGISVCLGTDGTACSDHQNMFEAMRMAAVSSRVRTTDQSRWLSAPEVFTLATGSTNRVLGGPPQLGALEEGMIADITLINSDTPCLHPLNDIVVQLVLAGSGPLVDTVLVDGRVVLRNGRSTLVDEQQILTAVDEAARALLGKSHKEWETAKRLAPYIAASSMAISPIQSPAWADRERTTVHPSARLPK